MGMISLVKQPELPAVFGRYVLLHRLARGGMGEVFLAKIGEIQGFEKPIVIKKILPDLSSDEEFLRRFVEEAQIAIKLAHSNIVPVYEMGMVEDQYFLAMEYVEGRDLREIINRCAERRRMLDPDLCLLLIREVANGLAYAHRRTDEEGRPIDLVHCDISPPNVVVSYEGEVRIIDFGVAKSAFQRAQANESMAFGKFGYMAPEQLIRGAEIDRRADIYSAGVLLYELLTGKRLFRFDQGTTYRQVARVVTAGKIDAPSYRIPGLPLELDALVMRALRTEPAERYQTAEELRDAVQQQLYSMNPTISADDLATVMRDLFVEEMKSSRIIRSLLSRTSVEPFQGELEDASNHTVSIALADKWTGSAPARGAIVEGVSVLFPPDEPGSREAARTAPGKHLGTRKMDPGTVVGDSVAVPRAEPEPGKGPSTRRLGAAEMLAAAGADPGITGPQPALPARPARGRLLLLLLAIVLVMVGAGVGAYQLTRSMQSNATAPADALAKNSTGEPGPGHTDLQQTPTAVAPDAGQQDSQAPVEVDAAPTVDSSMALPDSSARPVENVVRVRKKQPRPRRPRRRPRWKRPRKIKKATKPQKVSPRQVQRKFKRVRQEYQRFTRSYGHQLDSDWQKILFANTYGSMDESKYKRLNAMLDVLRLRMKQLRETSK